MNHPLPARGTRRGVSLASGPHALVTVSPPEPETGLSALARPAVPGVELAGWLAADLATGSSGATRAALQRYGAVLFRGFGVDSPEALGALVTAMDRTAAEYRYGSTPRTHLGSGVYTSTDYPADQAIPMHNEQSYAHHWPSLLLFACAQPARARGATPLADSRRVRERISPATRELFAGGVRYLRNYGRLGLPWPEVFGTEDRTEIGRFCADAGIDWEWLDEDRLRTVQLLPAERTHPITGERVWFNQAHLFHVSALPAELAAALLDGGAEEDLPRHAYLADGSPIPAAALDEIRAAYDAETTRFDWAAGDVLIVDNLLAAHAREPFDGPRRILVAMTG